MCDTMIDPILKVVLYVVLKHPPYSVNVQPDDAVAVTAQRVSVFIFIEL